MQTPAERKRLIAEGRYEELEPPQVVYGPLPGALLKTEPVPPVSVTAFRTTVAEVFEREPGEEG